MRLRAISILLFSLLNLAIANVVFAESKSANQKAKENPDMLLIAAKNGNIEYIKQLLDSGVDVNTEAKDGDTALIEASRKGHFSICK